MQQAHKQQRHLDVRLDRDEAPLGHVRVFLHIEGSEGGRGPLLCVLLAEAVVLRRAVQPLGGGLISQCWKLIATAVFLTCLEDLGLSLSVPGYLPWPLSAATWYLWFLAAYQVEAVRRACRDEQRLRCPAMQPISRVAAP